MLCLAYSYYTESGYDPIEILSNGLALWITTFTNVQHSHRVKICSYYGACLVLIHKIGVKDYDIILAFATSDRFAFCLPNGTSEFR